MASRMTAWIQIGLGLCLSLGAARAEETPIPPPPFEIEGHTVAAGESLRFAIAASESFAGAPVAVPVVVLHGTEPGPVLCLTAGIHGDEINGVEVVRRSVEQIEPEGQRGTVLAVPIVNLHGYRRGSRYLPDRRDLNRYFPGRARGSTASRIAQAVFDRVVRRCDHLLDFHTGSFQRVNLPHVRGDLSDAGVTALSQGLDGWLVLDHPGGSGTLRRAAVDVGIPAITFEVGAPYRVEEKAVARGLLGVHAVMAHLGMRGIPSVGGPNVVERSRWVRVDDGGLLMTDTALGQRVEAGELLGIVVDPISNQRSEVRSPRSGQILGMAFSQVVIPGFAAFHLGFAADGPAPPALDPHPAGPTGESDEPDDRPE